MHYQGRRWGGSHTYSAGQTFASYGVRFQGEATSPDVRQSLIDAVPREHQDFLQSLEWVHDSEVPFPPGRLVCVHAGLRGDTGSEEQLAALKRRDPRDANVLYQDDPGRFPAFSGREDVLPMPEDLAGKALLVSGHHGHLDVPPANGSAASDRIICDASGGHPSEERPITAVVLPQRLVVGSGTRRHGIVSMGS
eukprot:TRINITY_DN8965_c0_g1_i3.p1 TRINITY_DN8965_c0_g1~~TRINITY_DN8965_c0_g1_i3.p1  ORF type:complete len:194 (-),score=15.05 TRINITY_DN8965_c0_g1_i3:568-1149(-)